MRVCCVYYLCFRHAKRLDATRGSKAFLEAAVDEAKREAAESAEEKRERTESESILLARQLLAASVVAMGLIPHAAEASFGDDDDVHDC